METKMPETRISTDKRHADREDTQHADKQNTSSPRLPHEVDESFDSQTSKPRDDMKQAHDDIESGQIDTDRRGMPGVEEVRKDDHDATQKQVPDSSKKPSSTPKE